LYFVFAGFQKFSTVKLYGNGVSHFFISTVACKKLCDGSISSGLQNSFWKAS